jgi:hypothetical protein
MMADREANLTADRPNSELLRGAYDCRVHAAPDVVPRAQDWLDVGEAARAAGLAGLVNKDHGPIGGMLPIGLRPCRVRKESDAKPTAQHP